MGACPQEKGGVSTGGCMCPPGGASKGGVSKEGVHPRPAHPRARAPRDAITARPARPPAEDGGGRVPAGQAADAGRAPAQPAPGRAHQGGGARVPLLPHLHLPAPRPALPLGGDANQDAPPGLPGGDREAPERGGGGRARGRAAGGGPGLRGRGALPLPRVPAPGGAEPAPRGAPGADPQRPPRGPRTAPEGPGRAASPGTAPWGTGTRPGRGWTHPGKLRTHPHPSCEWRCWGWPRPRRIGTRPTGLWTRPRGDRPRPCRDRPHSHALKHFRVPPAVPLRGGAKGVGGVYLGVARWAQPRCWGQMNRRAVIGGQVQRVGFPPAGGVVIKALPPVTPRDSPPGPPKATRVP